MLMVSAIIAILVLMPPIYGESATDLEKFLDCSSETKNDIVFVFDTSGSMGGEINELCALADEFAKDLKASRVDYRLGLVEFRDFPLTCDDGQKTSCGDPDSFAYKIKGDENLTGEVGTFSTWLKSLSAKGGGDGPEAVLAALRHAMSDLQWRDDAEKTIIVLTDAPPHPDGDCCNAEGDTLDGTIFGLTGQGAHVHVIGPDDPSLKRIANETGGQFYKIRSGLSLKPLLKEITGAMSCSFRVETESTCENRVLKTKVRLVGKETIPFVASETEAWMYLDLAGNKSRYNLSYDSADGVYIVEVPEVCGPVELIVYGRVGERSAVQTVPVECSDCGATAAEEQGTLSISGRIYDDSNGDGIKGSAEVGLVGWDVLLLKPDSGSVAQESDRNGYYIFTGLLPGSYKVVTNAKENWTATAPETGVKEVELVDVHEAEVDFAYTPNQIENQPLGIMEKFNETFGGLYNDEFTSVQLASDGGYILAGSNELFRKEYEEYQSESAAWLLKVDSNGKELWNKTLRTGESYSVQVTDDDGYVFAGSSIVSARDWEGGAWLIKIDSEGNEIWNNIYFGDRESNEFVGLTSVQLTPDNGFILAGASYPRIPGEFHPYTWLIRTDSEGNEIWNKTFDITYCPGCDWPPLSLIVLPTQDGSYILAGNIYGGGARLIKIDSDGNEIWNKTFGGNYYPRSIQLAPDDGYILAGYLVYGNEDAWLLKVDSEGNELWNKTFGVGSNSISKFTSAQTTPDGDYILAGRLGASKVSWAAYGNGSNLSDAWLLKVDSEGNELWNKTFGGSNYDSASSVQPTLDGGCILAGTTASFGAGMTDAWLVKVDADGNTIPLPSSAG
jgi:hypothetical protein